MAVSQQFCFPQLVSPSILSQDLPLHFFSFSSLVFSFNAPCLSFTSHLRTLERGRTREKVEEKKESNPSSQTSYLSNSALHCWLLFSNDQVLCISSLSRLIGRHGSVLLVIWEPGSQYWNSDSTHLQSHLIIFQDSSALLRELKCWEWRNCKYCCDWMFVSFLWSLYLLSFPFEC